MTRRLVNSIALSLCLALMLTLQMLHPALGYSDEVLVEVSGGGGGEVTDNDLVATDDPAGEGSLEEVETGGDELTQEVFIGNSWRFSNGVPKEDVQLLSGEDLVSWKKENGSFVGSNGIIVDDAEAIGIDVSEWNGNIDWASVKAAGVDFAIIRCGWGWGGVDDAFAANIRGCQENGIPFGVYLYSYAWDFASSLEHADNALTILDEVGLSPEGVQLGVFYDLENEDDSGQPAGINKEDQYVPIASSAFSEIASAFCDRLEEAGYSTGIYANRNWFTNHLSDPLFDSWTRWVADYTGAGESAYTGDYSYWQCMPTGTVDGVTGAVDINFYYSDQGTTVDELAAAHRNDLADGTYAIRVSNSSSAVLDVQGASTQPGAKVNLWERKSTGDNQVWSVSHDSSGYVVLSNIVSGLVLGINSDPFSGVRAVQVEPSEDDSSQKWIAIKLGASYKLLSAADVTLVLDAARASTANGTWCELYSDNGGANQKWVFDAVSPMRERLDALATLNLNGAVLGQGSYVLRPSHESSLCLDVQGASYADGARANLWSYGGRTNQVWDAQIDSSGYVTFINHRSGLALDCGGPDSMRQREPNGSWEQKWVVVRDGSVFRLIPATNDALVLDVRGGSGSSGAQTIVYSDKGAANQRWILQSVNARRGEINDLAYEHASDLADGIYYVRVSNSSSAVLDVRGASLLNSAYVNLWARKGTSNQAWVVTHDAQGYVTIKNLASGKVLDVKGADASSGARLIQYTQNNGWNQKWIAVRSGSSFKLVSAMDGVLALDARRSGTSNGTWTELYSDNGGPNQRWVFDDFSLTRYQLLSAVDGINGLNQSVKVIGSDYKLSSSAGRQLSDAVSALTSRGYKLGFIMMDLTTGVGVCRNQDVSLYIASSIKGPYVAAVNKYYPSRVSAYWKNVMTDTIVNSSNSGYSSLRSQFGSSIFSSYMTYAGVSGRWSASVSYPYMRPRDLAKLWVANYWYFYEETNNNSAWCRSIFTHSSNSPIYYALGNRYTVHSKPGWYPYSPYWVQNDGGIVMANGRPYLISILSSACNEYTKLGDLVRALDAVHSDMTGSF